MTFTTNDMTVCSGGNHVEIFTDMGTIRMTMAELQTPTTGSLDEFRERVTARLRSAVLESNAVTFIGVRNAIRNKTFKI